MTKCFFLLIFCFSKPVLAMKHVYLRSAENYTLYCLYISPESDGYNLRSVPEYERVVYIAKDRCKANKDFIKVPLSVRAEVEWEEREGYQEWFWNHNDEGVLGKKLVAAVNRTQLLDDGEKKNCDENYYELFLIYLCAVHKEKKWQSFPVEPVIMFGGSKLAKMAKKTEEEQGACGFVIHKDPWPGLASLPARLGKIEKVSFVEKKEFIEEEPSVFEQLKSMEVDGGIDIMSICSSRSSSPSLSVSHSDDHIGMSELSFGYDSDSASDEDTMELARSFDSETLEELTSDLFGT